MSGRHSLVALAVGLALAGPAQAQLLISEYLEGSGNNKAVELSNLGSDLVDLPIPVGTLRQRQTHQRIPTNSLTLQGTLAPAPPWCWPTLRQQRDPGQGQPHQRQPGVQR